MALDIGSHVSVTYSRGDGQKDFEEGIVITLNAQYIEVTNTYGQNVAISWSHAARVYEYAA